MVRVLGCWGVLKFAYGEMFGNLLIGLLGEYSPLDVRFSRVEVFSRKVPGTLEEH